MSYLIGVAGTPGAGKTSLVLGLARAIGQRGAEHIQSRHRVNEVSRQLWQLLCDVGS